MFRRTAIGVLATLGLGVALAGYGSEPATAVGFVDTQVQASGLIIQNYVNAYGLAHHFTYPPKEMVEKGGGLDAPIWPSNPWTGKTMGPGTQRGTYTYAVRAGGRSYRLVLHLSQGNHLLSGGMPAWFKSERDQAAMHSLLLLQRYIDAFASLRGGVFPAASDLTSGTFGAAYAWPKNPWSGADMAASDELGDFAYEQTGSGTSYTLKVRLTTGWSAPLGPALVAALCAQAKASLSLPLD